MAGLDVTADLYDGDFIDPLVVLPALTEVNVYGLADATKQGIQITGSVQAASGHDLMQLPEGDQIGGVIKIYTLYPLTTGNAERAADRLVWRGAEYTVVNVQDYTNYAGGQGHVEALARLASINPSSLPRANDGGYLG